MSIYSIARIAVPTLMIGLLPSGCGDSGTEPSCSADVLVAGTVYGGMGPVEADLLFESLPGPADHPRTRARLTIDSNGRYSIGLPPGEYRARIATRTDPRVSGYYSREGVTSNVRDADTIRVVAGMPLVTVDFLLGSARLELQAPPELDRKVVSVELFSDHGRFRKSFTESQTESVIEFQALPFGAYVAGVTLKSGGLMLYLPGTYDRSAADSLHVSCGRTTRHRGVIPTPARISGRVEGSWQQMSAQLPVISLYSPDRRRLRTTMADQDGQFELYLFARGRACLVTSIHGIDQWYGPSYRFEDAAEFDLTPGDLVSGLRIVESGILGSLEGPDGLDRIDGEVRIIDELGRDVGATGIESGANSLRIPNLQVGTYYLNFVPNSGRGVWISQWYDEADSVESATPIVITREGEVVEIDINLHKGGIIRGHVIGVPEAAHHRVSILVRKSRMPGERYGSTDIMEDGSFTVVALPDGEFKIGTRLQGSSGEWWYPGVADWDSAGVIEIQGHEEVMGIELHLPE